MPSFTATRWSRPTKDTETTQGKSNLTALTINEPIAEEKLLTDALGTAHVAESASAAPDPPGRIPQQTLPAGNALVETSEAVEDALTEVRAEIARRHEVGR